MKRLRRVLFNALSALSLLLCVATTALWVRSYFFTDYLTLPSHDLYQAASGKGGLYLQKLSFVLRKDDWTTTPPPSGPPARLVKYKESVGNYTAWKYGGNGTGGRWMFESSAAGDWRILRGGIVPLDRSQSFPAQTRLSQL